MRLLAEREDFEEIAAPPAHRDGMPVYRTRMRDIDLAVFYFRIGAPVATFTMEEMFVMGAQAVVAYGSCGTLNREIAAQGLILPAAALRDEGTSYHYAPPSVEIGQDASSLALMRGTLKRLNIPYAEGKTWTTDAIYRETRAKAERRRAQGCVCVDMECSALIAAARFRQKRFAQYLYAADNLDASRWEARTLGGLNDDARLRYLGIALEIGHNLHLSIEETDKEETQCPM